MPRENSGKKSGRGEVFQSSYILYQEIIANKSQKEY